MGRIGFPMGQYVFHYEPSGDAPARDVERLRRDPRAKVVRADRDVVLVESRKHAVEEILAEMPGWKTVPTGAVQLPTETGMTRAERRSRRARRAHA